MVLAVTELQQAVVGHAPVAAGGGGIQPHALGLQVVHAQPCLSEGPFKGRPACIITQGLQHGRQPVVAQVQGMAPLAGRAAQGLEALRGPRWHLGQAMICRGQDMG
jgi:hypothetical protein